MTRVGQEEEVVIIIRNAATGFDKYFISCQKYLDDVGRTIATFKKSEIKTNYIVWYINAYGSL